MEVDREIARQLVSSGILKMVGDPINLNEIFDDLSNLKQMQNGTALGKFLIELKHALVRSVTITKEYRVR